MAEKKTFEELVKQYHAARQSLKKTIALRDEHKAELEKTEEQIKKEEATYKECKMLVRQNAIDHGVPYFRLVKPDRQMKEYKDCPEKLIMLRSIKDPKTGKEEVVEVGEILKSELLYEIIDVSPMKLSLGFVLNLRPDLLDGVDELVWGGNYFIAGDLAQIKEEASSQKEEYSAWAKAKS